MSDSELQLDIERLSPRAMVALATRSSMRAMYLIAVMQRDVFIKRVRLTHTAHLLGLFVATTTFPLPSWWPRELYELSGEGDSPQLAIARPLLQAIFAVAERRPTDVASCVRRTLERASATLSELGAGLVNVRATGAAQEDYDLLLGNSAETVPQWFFERPLFEGGGGYAIDTTDRVSQALPLTFGRSLIDPSERQFSWEDLERFVRYPKTARLLASEVREQALPDDTGSALTLPRRQRESDRRRRERVVNTGFVLPSSPNKPLSPSRPLWPGRSYCFWLEVGPPVEGSIETTPAPLPVDLLPAEATLTVALFGFPRGIAVTPGADIGRIALQPDGRVAVVSQPGGSRRRLQPPGDLGDRLYFPVRAPTRIGEARLRCNIYYEQVLVQSRLITVRVLPWPLRAARALASTLEYSLSRSLAPQGLRGISPHRLSVMLNDDGGRSTSHQFRFFGADDFKAEATLGEGELDDIIRQARAVMRGAAWGTEAEWQKEAYKYESPAPLPQLSADLISLARTGYRLYRKILPRLAQGRLAQDALETLMVAPGSVQFASKSDVRQYLPASLIYDHPLDTNLPSTICPLFLAALDRHQNLAATPCFVGGCPSKADLRVVCPSGFWGFRHDVSFPLSAAADVTTVLSATAEPNFLMAISTTLDEALPHERALHGLRQYKSWNQGNTRATTLSLLMSKELNIVYFYCHGGFDGTVPFIQVGSRSEAGITSDNLGAYKVFWNQPGPLVFINGCRTTALQPSVAFDLVTSLIQDSQAAGVIGTEITVFEPLARTFAESFFRAFLVDGQNVGAAVRRARLSLLEAHNPLGLVYVPFALGSISLTTPPAAAGIAPESPRLADRR